MSDSRKVVDDCLFCRISRGDLPAEVIMEDDDFIAIKDIYPKAPVHVLIIPRQHIKWLNGISEMEPARCQAMLEFIVEVARKLGVDQSGYRVINNVGSGGGQVIFHLHWHLLAGRSAGFDIREGL